MKAVNYLAEELLLQYCFNLLLTYNWLYATISIIEVALSG